VDPISLVMIALIGVLIIFMFRNGKKRRQAMEQLQSGLRPGAGVMLQSGIFGIVESVDEENSRVTILSGDSTLVVHRNAVGQITEPVDAPIVEETVVAPDDDPEFSPKVVEEENVVIDEDRRVADADPAVERPTDEGDDRPNGGAPKA